MNKIILCKVPNVPGRDHITNHELYDSLLRIATIVRRRRLLAGHVTRQVTTASKVLRWRLPGPRREVVQTFWEQTQYKRVIKKIFPSLSFRPAMTGPQSIKVPVCWPNFCVLVILLVNMPGVLMLSAAPGSRGWGYVGWWYRVDHIILKRDD